MKKILVTSSTGLTGRAVVKYLSKVGVCVRAMVHSDRHVQEILTVGAEETVIASVDDADDMRRAMNGVDTVFYICPTAHPREGEIGIMAIDLASELGVERFVYQSVHNSIEPGLIHHRQKLMVEQHLLESALSYTILRPAAFMQNILSNAKQIREEHLFSQRFFINDSASNRINLIDVDNYGEIAAKVTLGEDYDYAQLDLCGPQNLSVKDMLDALSEAVSSEINLHYITDKDFISFAESRKMPRHTLDVLLAMFRSYNRYGFLGNSYVASKILGRPLNKFSSFAVNALR
ncbi:MAG: NmrA family NAD(P)-binding protein [Bacteroides sp.]|nr:NmrA family NAD(P)-binding protein [Bacteroides sp.]